ncbi:MAG: dihydrofolate reductase [Pirellula sp.]
MSDHASTNGLPKCDRLEMIVARARNGTIGDRDALPWKLHADLQRFKRLTMGHAILMGRKTYESIGRLLPGRQTIILSRRGDWQVPGACVVPSLEAALAIVPPPSIPFVVGGAEIYRLAWPSMRAVHITHVLADVPGDTVLPPLSMEGFRCVESECVGADERNDWPTRYERWMRVDPTGNVST